MRISLFCHSLLSDWNHGNAHFLRGVATGLSRRGHQVVSYEPRNSWSFVNCSLEGEFGEQAALAQRYPALICTQYDLGALDLERIVDSSDLVIVHEWNAPELICQIAALRRHKRNFVAFFHDSHHRMATQPAAFSELELDAFDAVLAFGRSLAEYYLKKGLVERALVWHESADPYVFYPRASRGAACDVTWIGNWGDDERTAELRDYFIQPVRQLQLCAEAFGVRYPHQAIEELNRAGISYRGWLPNFRVPEVFAGAALTLHIPRRPYRDLLPGIPTIRIFEALACGIPLVCAPWEDCEALFAPDDFLIAHDPEEMARHITWILTEPAAAAAMAARAHCHLLERHTCAHRVDELLTFYTNAINARGA